MTYRVLAFAPPSRYQPHPPPQFGLKNSLGSPNGAMRRGWNGITISRDTIHIDGVELGFKKPVLFERHAVGGEYGAGWKTVGKVSDTSNYP